jgi:DNA-binding NtrC family response regulator
MMPMGATIETLLVVDDDKALLKSAVRELGRKCRVVTAVSATEARELFSREPIDLAVIDVLLRDTSGIDLMIELIRAKPDLPAIMISGLFYADTMRLAFRAGALDCFDKPFAWPEVFARLEHGPDLENRSTVIPTFQDAKGECLRRVMAAFDGNVSHAAAHLRVDRRTLQRTKKSLGGNES